MKFAVAVAVLGALVCFIAGLYLGAVTGTVYGWTP